MTAALALVQVIMAMLPNVVTGVTALIAFIENVRTAAQQTSEWTPAMEAAYRQSLFDTNGNPIYQPAPPAPPVASGAPLATDSAGNPVQSHT